MFYTLYHQPLIALIVICNIIFVSFILHQYRLLGKTTKKHLLIKPRYLPVWFSMALATVFFSCYILYFFYPNIFLNNLSAEDSLFENLTAIIYLWISYSILKTPNKGIAQYLILIVCVFLFGEEISWGQRIFDFPTPQFFKNINYQNEFTIHNTKAGGFLFIFIVILPALIYIVVLPWLSKTFFSSFFALLHKLKLPTTHRYHSVIFILLVLFFGAFDSCQELAELLVALLIASIVIPKLDNPSLLFNNDALLSSK